MPQPMSPVAYTTRSPPKLLKAPPPKGAAAMDDDAQNGANTGVGGGGGSGGDDAEARARAKQAAIDDITARVRTQSDRLQRILAPYADAAKSFADARPVLFTFIAIFGALSAIPILCTGAFLATATAFLTVAAAVVLACCVIGTFVLAMTFLVPVLAITASLATAAVVGLLALFLAHRLYLHVRWASGRAPGLGALVVGFRSWADETLGRIGVGAGHTMRGSDTTGYTHHAYAHSRAYAPAPAPAYDAHSDTKPYFADIKPQHAPDANHSAGPGTGGAGATPTAHMAYSPRSARQRSRRTSPHRSTPHVQIQHNRKSPPAQPHDLFSPPQPAAGLDSDGDGESEGDWVDDA